MGEKEGGGGEGGGFGGVFLGAIWLFLFTFLLFSQPKLGETRGDPCKCLYLAIFYAKNPKRFTSSVVFTYLRR